MTVLVRPARPGDGESLPRAWVSATACPAGPGQFPGPSAEDLAELWDDASGRGDKDTLQLVAELDGHVAGWLLARVWPAGINAAPFTVLSLDVLLVAREHWRRGAGTALLEAAESWGSARGAQVARLATFAASPVAVPFYEQRMGYQQQTIIFEKRLRPSVP